MCQLCASSSDVQGLASRAHVLQLVALIEHPDALPAEAAMRLAREILILAGADGTKRRCDPVVPPEPAIAQAR